MEFPDVGQQCSESSCRRLDFLPVKCDACNKIYCTEHYSYAKHSCPESYRKDVQVPICPLCNSPVSGKPDELPDIRVSRHIDSNCQSDKALQRKTVYTNRCSHKNCKQKELIPIKCDKCALNFCLKHRHPVDHACTQKNAKPLGKAAMAAMSRNNASSSNNTETKSQSSVSNFFRSVTGTQNGGVYNQSKIQGSLPEDVALQLALQASMNDGSSSTPAPTATNLTQEQEDFLLAQAIAQSERDARNSQGSESKVSISSSDGH